MTSAKHTFVWDGRGDRGAGARMSWLAGGAADDLRLTCLHFRILAHLGQFNNKKGWCRLSQMDLAAMFGVHRQSVNKAISELVEWEYIEKQSQQQTGESFCLYRTVIDPQGVSDQADTPPDPAVSAEADTRVTPRQPPVSPHTTPNNDHVYHVDTLPPTPRKRRGAREVALEGLIQELCSNPEHERVVDHLIAPAIRLRAFSAPNKRFALEQIADSAKGLSNEELADTIRRLTETRRQSVKQAHFEDAIKATKEAALALSKKRHAAQRRNRDPAMAARTVALHERLRNRLGREIFESWFTGLECEGLDGAVLTVSVEIPFKKNWFGSHYRDDLEEQAREEFGSGFGRVDVIVREAGRVAA